MISSLENSFNELFQLLNFKFKMNKIRSLHAITTSNLSSLKQKVVESFSLLLSDNDLMNVT